MQQPSDAPVPGPAALARAIEHTALAATIGRAQVARLCAETLAHGFVGACVNSAHVPQVASALRGTPALTVATVGFPLGAASCHAKASEAGQAAADGADEIDMVLSLGALLAGDAAAVRRDIAAVVRACAPLPVKVIVEACLLAPPQLELACDLAEAAGAAFVKTSTGFAAGGATAADVRAMRARVGARLGVKAAGGIRTAAAARAMLDAGASRLGCSASVAIVGAPRGDAAPSP